eukprot:gene7373-1227_t
MAEEAQRDSIEVIPAPRTPKGHSDGEGSEEQKLGWDSDDECRKCGRLGLCRCRVQLSDGVNPYTPIPSEKSSDRDGDIELFRDDAAIVAAAKKEARKRAREQRRVAQLELGMQAAEEVFKRAKAKYQQMAQAKKKVRFAIKQVCFTLKNQIIPVRDDPGTKVPVTGWKWKISAEGELIPKKTVMQRQVASEQPLPLWYRSSGHSDRGYRIPWLLSKHVCVALEEVSVGKGWREDDPADAAYLKGKIPPGPSLSCLPRNKRRKKQTDADLTGDAWDAWLYGGEDAAVDAGERPPTADAQRPRDVREAQRRKAADARYGPLLYEAACAAAAARAPAAPAAPGKGAAVGHASDLRAASEACGKIGICPSAGLIAALRNIRDLHEDGLLPEGEFEKQRASLLGKESMDAERAHAANLTGGGLLSAPLDAARSPDSPWAAQEWLPRGAKQLREREPRLRMLQQQRRAGELSEQ